MSKYSFLAVPLKTTSDVDLVKPLTSYIDSVYNTSDDDRAEISEAVQELNKLRSKACCQPLDKHQSALDVLTRYYDQLIAIENKIIISATQNPVVFKWKDAFDKGSLFFSKASLSMSDGSFERAAVLFNCGALMSQIAAAQPMITDEELKTAAKLFQQSAGVFARLRDSVLGMVQQDPTPDLMPDTLASLSAVMIAQAQESIYIKAYRDKMKSTALVKIVAQVAEFYTDALKLMTKDVVKGLWEKEWLSLIMGKKLAYQAVAQIHQAEVNAENREIGEQLSRLSEAISLTTSASKYLPSGCLSDQLTPLQKTYALATKDNDFIYHERVPDFRSLPALHRAALAKPTPITGPLSPRFKDMFSSLVPVQVHNAMQSYEGRKAELVNIETGRLREHTQLMNGILASLNLPAALDDVTSSENLPESIKQKSAKVKQSGGLSELQRIFVELPNLYKRNEEILDETNRLLTEEKESDDILRRQFGTKWTRMTSEQLTSPLLQEIGKYRGILHTASNADKMVKEKFEMNMQAIQMLSKSEIELRNAIPGQQHHEAGGVTETVEKLRALMDQVQAIKVERESIEKELKTVNCDIANDFMKALTESQLLNEEHISKEKIQELYGPLCGQVTASIKKQDNIMAEIEIWNNRFTGEKAGSVGGAERERILKMLAAGYDTFYDLKGNLEEGTKFYNDLTPILVRLQQKVSDFSFARQTEKEDLMRQMQQNIVSGGAGSGNSSFTGGSAPPPRPPPPAPRAQQEAPIAPPRTQQNLQGAVSQTQSLQPTPPIPEQPMIPQQQTQMHPGYYQQSLPYGQPQPFFYQPHYQPNVANPYPTFPGAFPNYQQSSFGHFPQPPLSSNPFAPPNYQQPPTSHQ